MFNMEEYCIQEEIKKLKIKSECGHEKDKQWNCIICLYLVTINTHNAVTFENKLLAKYAINIEYCQVQY